MAIKPECAKCSGPVCLSPDKEGPNEFCPTKIKKEVIQKAVDKTLAEFKEFARCSSIQEGQGYLRLPFAPKGPSPVKTRLEEIVEFSKKMGYKRLGVAFCGGVHEHAVRLVDILERKGFDIVSVCCKCGAFSKQTIGVKREEQVTPERGESMCNPIAQAEILNSESTDFNIMLCLCVGHDSLFLKHSKALCTVFAVKDRALAHNPLGALWTSHDYYRRLLSRE
ncbi:MAG: DUF1847 domain-containing protein [Chloroflexota bacterium]